jgi:type II secretion system (T2SS) protein F
MGWAASWALLAAATWLAPWPRRPATPAAAPAAAVPASAAAPAAAPAAASPRAGRRVPPRVLQVTAGLAVLTAGIGVLGPPRGLLAGCLLVPASGLLVRRLHDQHQRVRPSRALALSLDLAAAALRSGRPLPAALVLAAPAAGPPTAATLAGVAGLLRLGAEPIEAWRGVSDNDVLAPVAQAARRSAHSGARLARGFEQVAGEIRAQVQADAQARAHGVGVLAMAPLGLCFLPAFVCLGVVPVVVGLARDAFGALP